MSGYVYIIHAKGTNLYKIGMTSDSVEKRLKQLQTGNPLELKIIKSFPASSPQAVEKYLHKQWRDNKVRDEWFEFDSIEPVIKSLQLATIGELFFFDMNGLSMKFVTKKNGVFIDDYFELLDTEKRTSLLFDWISSIHSSLSRLEGKVEYHETEHDMEDAVIPWEFTSRGWWEGWDSLNEASGCSDY